MSQADDLSSEWKNGDLPLFGVRIVELTDGAGEMAARILGDLGADVIRVESPAGASSRNQEPCVDGVSLYYETQNANKRAVSLNLGEPSGRTDFLRLLQTADILIVGCGTSLVEALDLEPARLRRLFPTLVVVSYSDFGRTGPYRDWVATEWVHAALGGVLSRSGLPGREPLLPPGTIVTASSSLTTAWAALIAYYNRQLTGAGDDVDVAVFESTTQIIDPGFGMAGSASGGIPASDGPRDRPDAGHLYPIFACADGYVRLCILSPRQWQGMLEWMGRPVAFSDPELGNLAARLQVITPIQQAIGQFLAEKTRDEAVREGQLFGVPCGSLLDLSEVMAAEHYSERRAFVGIETAAGMVRVPNGYMEIDGKRAGIRMPAPTHGQHNLEVLGNLPPLEPPGPEASVPMVRKRPLDGIRVLDFGVIVAGGETGRLLADMGADVIKIENTRFPDGSRQFAGDGPISPVFAWGHRNKQSVGIDVRSEEGHALLMDLVAQSDVVLSNFKPGTMEKLGLSYDDLYRVNPRIIACESSAFGSSGPWSERLGYGPLVRASTALSSSWKYPDSDDGFCDATTVYPDHAAARVAVIGVVAQLIRRRRTGLGGRVGLAQAETIIGQNACFYALQSVAPSVGPERQAGRLPDAPRGVYPAAGDDEWVVIDVRHDDDWRHFVQSIGAAELAADPRFDSAESRYAHRAVIDELVREWTTTRSPHAIAHFLQRNRIPAAMMLRLHDLVNDDHLIARRVFRKAVHPHIARDLPSENLPAQFRNIPDAPLQPAPLMGEHTREIATRLLNLPADEIERLIAHGVLEETVLAPTNVGSAVRPMTATNG